jgi:hypothetical protein
MRTVTQFLRGPLARSFVVSASAGLFVLLLARTSDAQSSGQPPPGYYGQPYPPPPGPAYYQAPEGPPLVLHGWDPDVPPPAGYELRSSANGRLIGTGIGLFSVGYVTSVVVGLVAVASERPAVAQDWIPMFFPIGGPFASIATLDASSAETGLLVADGLVQLGGLVAIIAGALDTRFKIVRLQIGSNESGSDDVTLEVTPMVGATDTGLRTRVEF